MALTGALSRQFGAKVETCADVALVQQRAKAQGMEDLGFHDAAELLR